MPVHDWTRVGSSIFLDFRHSWIEEIQRNLNADILTDEYYAMTERHVIGPASDPLAWRHSSVFVRRTNDDRLAAIVELVQRSNKSSRPGIRLFVENAAELLDQRIQLVVVDVLPPGARDPNGIHGEIWEEISGEEYQMDPQRPLTVASYESALTVRAYVEHVAVGDVLPDMPLFLEPNGQVPLPLEVTYQAAWAVFPRRWRSVVEGS